MPSTGITNVTLIAIYKDISGTLTKIANATSNDFSITKDMIETTNKIRPVRKNTSRANTGTP